MIKEFQGEYRFLSNFWPCTVIHDGFGYQNAESAYQAAKTNDLEERIQFFNCEPGKAKRLGRKVRIRKDWESVKDQIMYEIVYDKFTRNYNLAQQLRDTGDQELVEGNAWRDTYWGICSGIGQNKLGKILMLVRDKINE